MGSNKCIGRGVVVNVTEVAVGLRHGCGSGSNGGSSSGRMGSGSSG